MYRTRRESSGVWDTLLIVAVAALAAFCTHAPQARADGNDSDQGAVVTISPQTGVDINTNVSQANANANNQNEPAAPAFWLGIEGGPLDSDVLRTQFQ